MVTELTPNLLKLLKSDNVEDNNLALVLMNYNETRTDYDKLENLLRSHDLELFYINGKNGSNYFPIENMVIIDKESVDKKIMNHGEENTEST